MHRSVTAVPSIAKSALRRMLPVAALVLGAAAPAYAETEPNNESATASGPLIEAVAAGGDLFSADDVDYHRIYARRGAQIQVAYAVTAANATQPSGVANAVDFRVTDARSAGSVQEGAYQVGAGETGTVAYVVPATGTYYVEVTVSPGFRATTEAIPYTLTATGGVLSYDPIKCDRRKADERRIRRSLNRAEAQKRNAQRRGRSTRAIKRKVMNLTRQHDLAVQSRDNACR